MTLASATCAESSPARFFTVREEARHDNVPSAALTIPAAQFATFSKRTAPVVWSVDVGAVTPIPTLPSELIDTRSASVAPLRVQSCRLPDASVAPEPERREVTAALILFAELAPV